LLAGEAVHIRVHSYNRIVLLTGEVPGPAEREQADAVVRRLPNVRQVYNELVIGPPASLTSRANDFALATKVKASLFNVPGDLVDFNPTRVQVVTEQGTVYLFGLLRPEEAAAVTEQVRWVSGVQKVVTLYEFLEPQPQG
jgi:osmotically-inducible protein OsmY